MKEDLLFYNEYEDFYQMADTSKCFKKYCEEAFGADFSQDGFSDLTQINLILKYAPKVEKPYILDIGCGDGKMLKYLQENLGGYIYGFDYSDNAISSARKNRPVNAEFKTGVIGEMQYPEKSFDLIVSMDTVYFADDMTAFIGDVKSWLKDKGVFIVGYQEGDIMPKTNNGKSTALAKAFYKNEMYYDVVDLTEETYKMLKKKRQTILKYEDDFYKEGLGSWFNVILNQTDSSEVSFEEYSKENARYLYIVRK